MPLSSDPMFIHEQLPLILGITSDSCAATERFTCVQCKKFP
jgi:hypothetical protein